jgi:hypothetical protein
MTYWSSLASVMHLIGLVLAVGAATVKLVLLLRCHTDPAFALTFLKVSKHITRQIVVGMILLALSGIGWLFLGYGFSPRLIVKLVLFGAIWVVGPVIDHVVEPRFQKLARGTGEPATPAFTSALRQYLAWETIATSLFYVIIVMWVFR